MNKRDLQKLTKSQLIKLLLKEEKSIQDRNLNNHTKQSLDGESAPHKDIKEIANGNNNLIIPLPERFHNRPQKPKSPPTPPPKDPFNLDDHIFQTENQSLEKFKIISVQSRKNKKFKSFTNEFKVKILKKLDDTEEIYHIFQELVKTVKRR